VCAESASGLAGTDLPRARPGRHSAEHPVRRLLRLLRLWRRIRV